jgi:hypothetical protein
MNKKILYGLLGIGIVGGGYLLYKKYKKKYLYLKVEKKEETGFFKVDVIDNDKVVYSTLVSKRNLKNNDPYNGLLTSNGSFTLKEFQRTDGITHDFAFELYDSKGNMQQRFFDNLILKK